MSLITADAVYHNESNLKQLAGVNMDALIADNGMWQRDERFKDQDKHKQSRDVATSRNVSALRQIRQAEREETDRPLSSRRLSLRAIHKHASNSTGCRYTSAA